MSNLDSAGVFSTLYTVSPADLSQMNSAAQIAAPLAGMRAAANPTNPVAQGAAFIAAETAAAIQTAKLAQDANNGASC